MNRRSVVSLAILLVLALTSGCGQNYWDIAPDQARPPAMQSTASTPEGTTRALERHFLPLPVAGATAAPPVAAPMAPEPTAAPLPTPAPAPAH